MGKFQTQGTTGKQTHTSGRASHTYRWLATRRQMMVKHIALLLCLLTGSLTAMAAEPEQAAAVEAKQAQSPQGLDQQVQDLKKKVLELNRDLFILEEELLFPATTQVAVFLSVDVGEFFQLDSVQLKIDDKVVTNYLYTERESEALKRGGVQRLHLGNLRVGKHELVAFFVGKGPHGRDYRRGTTTVFEKGTEPKNLELKIVDSQQMQQPDFVVKEWQ
jgi:hypothetical protein